MAATPFLPVKHSTARTTTTPVAATAQASADAIRAFAAACLRELRARPMPALPDEWTLGVQLPPPLSAPLAALPQLTERGPGQYHTTGSTWQADAPPVLATAMTAALQPWLQAIERIDVSSREAVEHADADAVAAWRAYIEDWMATNYPDEEAAPGGGMP